MLPVLGSTVLQCVPDFDGDNDTINEIGVIFFMMVLMLCMLVTVASEKCWEFIGRCGCCQCWRQGSVVGSHQAAKYGDRFKRCLNLAENLASGLYLETVDISNGDVVVESIIWTLIVTIAIEFIIVWSYSVRRQSTQKILTVIDVVQIILDGLSIPVTQRYLTKPAWEPCTAFLLKIVVSVATNDDLMEPVYSWSDQTASGSENRTEDLAEKGRLINELKKALLKDGGNTSELMAQVEFLEAQLVQEEVAKKAEQAETVLCAFVVDCTYSMATHIQGVKDSIRAVSMSLQKRAPKGKLYVAFVGYRDFGDKDQFVVHEFSEDIPLFQQNLDAIKATGGGDYCEDVIGGLTKVLSLDWKRYQPAFTRLIIHFGDAPNHGQAYHDGLSDSYKHASYDHKKVLLALHNIPVQYTFGRIFHHTDKMITVFNNSMEDVVGGDFITVGNASDPRDLYKFISKSCMDSIMTSCAGFHVRDSRLALKLRTSTHDATGPLQRRPSFGYAAFQGITHLLGIETVDADEEDVTWDEPKIFKQNANLEDQPWSFCRVRSVTSLAGVDDLRNIQSKFFKSMRSCLGTSHFLLAQHEVAFVHDSASWRMGPRQVHSIRIAEAPFAKGNCRWAYYAEMKKEQSATEPYVLKRFQGDTGHFLDRYVHQMKVSWAAALLAEEFGKDPMSAGLPKVECVKSHVIEMWGTCFFWTAEKVLPGGKVAWKRFTDNLGHYDMQIPDVLLKFIKFTYEKTNQAIIVSDLQGVHHNGTYMLTDLAIHSKLRIFGETDLGERMAMQTYLEIEREIKTRERARAPELL